MAAEVKPGTAYLQFSRADERTVLTRALATSPAKLIATNPGRAACWVYAATLGGGLVGGDHIDLSVDVQEGARALLTTQASTKVYRSLRRSRQSMTATIGDGALLAVLPDPIVCYAQADFAQTQRYELAAGASLVLVDWMTSGRHHCGEQWAFSRYESRVMITRDDRAVFMDAVRLEPGRDTVAARMSGCHVLLTLVMTGALVRDAADEVLRHVSAQPIGPLIAASSLSRGGIVVRMAGTSVEHVGRTLREHLTFLDPLIGGNLWSRKW